MRGRVIHCVDAHAEGEPSRIIVGGVLDVPGDTMLEKMQHLEREGDDLRRLLLFEPRGSAPLSLDLVLPSSHPEADAGFLIMESCSYEGMSGSNTINTATVLLETGMLPMTEPVTSRRAGGAGGPRARPRRLPRRPLRAHHVRERAVVRQPSRRPRRGPGDRGAAGRRRLRRRVLRVRRRRGARLRDRSRGGARARRPRRAHPPGGRRAAGDRPSGRAGPRRPLLRRLHRRPARRRRRPQRDRRRPGAPGPLRDRHGDLRPPRRARRPRPDRRRTSS